MIILKANAVFVSLTTAILILCAISLQRYSVVPEGFGLTSPKKYSALDYQSSSPSIESCDQNGVIKDTFSDSNTIYVKGSGIDRLTRYDIYVVVDINWTDSVTIPSRVTGTATSIISDIAGNINPTGIWIPPLTDGKYDIILDVNGNGRYDNATDALDNNDIAVTAGFIVNEHQLPAMIAVFAISAGLASLHVRKRQV